MGHEWKAILRPPLKPSDISAAVLKFAAFENLEPLRTDGRTLAARFADIPEREQLSEDLIIELTSEECYVLCYQSPRRATPVLDRISKVLASYQTEAVFDEL